MAMSETVKFRCTPEEMADWQAEAAKENLSLSDWIKKYLNPPVPAAKQANPPTPPAKYTPKPLPGIDMKAVMSDMAIPGPPEGKAGVEFQPR